MGGLCPTGWATLLAIAAPGPITRLQTARHAKNRQRVFSGQRGWQIWLNKMLPIGSGRVF